VKSELRHGVERDGCFFCLGETIVNPMDRFVDVTSMTPQIEFLDDANSLLHN